MGLDVELHLPPEIHVGGGVSERAGELAQGLGLQRVLVVTDPVMVDTGVAGRVAEHLAASGIATATFSEIRGEPTTDYVDAGVAALREHEADGVLAVGGGSPLDTAKAIAVMATNEGPLPEFLGYHKIPRPGLPLIAVPTTAGTGSEVTRVTVITDTSRDVKMMILSNHLMPQVALADYKLTLTCPPALTANVGVDSLTHAIESYVSAKANPVTDMLALRAAALIGQNLRRAQRDGGDEEAREALMLGAMLAGAAFSNASVALVHGMSRPIGAHFHVPHGLSNAVLLPTITRWSVDGARARYATIARHMGLADERASDEEATSRLVDELDALNADLGVPRLGELDGVERAHFDRVKADMAEAALASGSPGFNPRVPEAGEIVALYDEAW
jgi:alcohol dehydrogenase class IV